MALGKKCSSMKSKRGGGGGGGAVNGEDNVLGLGFVRYTRSLGRKRVLISNNNDDDDEHVSPVDSNLTTPLKRQCSERFFLDDKSALESLPQDVLIRILCGVDHDDLKQLFHVSKPIREATLIAKQWHFAYSTPTKTRRRVFKTSIDFDKESSELDEIEAPNAPKQRRVYKSRINGKNLANISVALFG